MDETEENTSIDSIEVGPTSPHVLVTPRIPIPVMMRETPLSTKRERQAITPRFRRPAPRMIKTVPQTRSIWAVAKDTTPRLVTPHGPKPLESPKYDRNNSQTFFEQVFQIDEIIGRGSFGEVFRARCREDSQMYAIKVSIAPMRQHSISKYREAESHMIIPPHKNLVKFYRAWEETDHLYIQTELCDQSLQQYCTVNHALPENDIWNIFVDLLEAVHHLHTNDMIHDDIKPENIFLTKHKICKLGDFGLVINLKNPNDVKSAEEGDSKYLAPEVLNGKPTFASDIFSLGVTILEAATDLDVPSSGDSWHQIRNGEIPERFFVGISTDLRVLIEQMIDKDPKKRPTSRVLRQHQSIRKRREKRSWFIMSMDLIDNFTSFMSSILVWCMAFLSVVFHPIACFSEAIKNRRSEICAQFVNNQQHTPIHTPETSKAYSESLTGVALRQQATAPVSPFDFSDDENPPHSQRRPLTAVSRRLNFDENLDDDDDEQATCSSSNSSAIESVDDSISPKRNPVIPVRGTPKSARRLLSSYRSQNVPPHAGSGDGFNNNSLREKERTERYLRMFQAEKHLDWNDHSNMIDEAPPPMSCPPRIRRSVRDTRVPTLNFNLLDEPKNTEENVSIVSPKNSPAGIRQRPLRIGGKSLRSRLMSFQGSSGDEI
ncbi:hypothetical protein GCK72_003644 [Caenorhabditis remanei]|uniref:Membrane-associated tyrosine- and threonine-specific cdc2-inhibitory kinase wee-1.3 n=1 Tax=Caenorhabditis remanei TaxID=31234 RepID=A0A6A5H9I1_CAERE|nr:hypothetical protein GCK72_003644 [Caenorhabditis remanei]KAF1763699.1 hypothetical protein GCK72_003644 [Caenorhabditis remanei]